MSRTWLSVLTALGLVIASAAIFVVRRTVLGPESAGPLGWAVSIAVDGTLVAKDASISVLRPLDFRHQHISEERFQGGKELREPLHRKRTGQEKHTWRRQRAVAQPEPFHLEYSFVVSLQRPGPAVERLTARIDAAPAAGAYLKSTPHIEAKDQRITQTAEEQAGGIGPVRDQARALLDFVSRLAENSSPEQQSAWMCLERGAGNSLGKARLLTALCRSRGVPARVISGLVLAQEGAASLHHWTEAWLDDRWTPMDPTRGHFDSFPDNYLVLRVGDGPVVSMRGVRGQAVFSVHPRQEAGADLDQAASRAKNFWRRVSFYSLHVSEQHMVEFLLLLPLGALIVSIARTLIGIQTFGIFAPALIGLAFLDLRALLWGLPILILTILVGWGLRHVLERYHLLQVPRVSAIVTLIVIFLLAMVVMASNLGISTTRYVSLFPLVILTFLVERFWTIEAEDGTTASFHTLLGTILVAIAVSLALGPPVVRTWMFRYPETLGVVLAALFLLGRYTGYRLTELYRFEDLIKEEQGTQQ